MRTNRLSLLFTKHWLDLMDTITKLTIVVIAIIVTIIFFLYVYPEIVEHWMVEERLKELKQQSILIHTSHGV